METKFIEGTNNQYSIREDGVVIRHYIIHSRNNKKYYKEYYLYGYREKDIHRIKLSINKERKDFLVKLLVYDYFSKEERPKSHWYVILHRDNDPMNCHIDNLYMEYYFKDKTGLDRPLTKKEQSKRYYNTESYKKSTKKFYNSEAGRLSRQKYTNKTVDNITKNYVARILKLKIKELPDDLYELCKIKLQTKRLLATKLNIHITSLQKL